MTDCPRHPGGFKSQNVLKKPNDREHSLAMTLRDFTNILKECYARAEKIFQTGSLGATRAKHKNSPIYIQ